ncbi:hypothetical protein CcCBS67573_g10117 [Chytriomyces confervae]|uniref:Uncharacterized protein n=1 Tax=Chytriomyces confervae TaxID=246404 RepID=A0A507DGM0_9FUNG|nr:hypothetical protein CcCBS67573_g10117 [Chytriomyces confervae]
MCSLKLSHNQLSGPLPKFGEWMYIETLHLDHNQFSGHLPTDNRYRRSLKSVNFSYNQLSGPISEFISSRVFTESLNLSNNSFSGTLPRWSRHSLQEISTLDLSSNQLSGLIPEEFLLSCQVKNNKERFIKKVDSQRNVFELALRNADTLYLAYNAIELQAKTFDFLSNETMHGNPNASAYSAYNCTPVCRGSLAIENLLDRDSSDSESKDSDFIPESSPQSEDSQEYVLEMPECQALDFQQTFLWSRDTSADTPLLSGKCIESVFEQICLHDHGDAKERAEQSWVLNIEDHFSMSGFSQQDQGEVRRIWSNRRSMFPD